MSGATVSGRVAGGTNLRYQDYEKTGTYVYVGYKNIVSGAWVIERRTLASFVRLDASGTSAYTTAWTGRAGLTYA